MVADDHDEAYDGEADKDQVFKAAHDELAARGQPDADNCDHEHDQHDGGGDQDIGPGARGVGTEDG